MTNAQCPLVDFVDALPDARAPRLSVRSDVLEGGEPLSLSVEGVGGAASLFVATPDGTMVNVTSLARTVDGAVMLELPRTAFASGAGSNYLMMAVTADRAFPAMDRERADDPRRFLAEMRREAEGRRIELGASLKALRVR